VDGVIYRYVQREMAQATREQEKQKGAGEQAPQDELTN
jgi:hypothetical protein